MKISLKIIFFSIVVILICPKELMAKEKIKIGLLVPLSGNQSYIGKSIVQSTRLAINKIDNNNIEIIPKNSKNNPEETLAAAKQLAEEGVKIVFT